MAAIDLKHATLNIVDGASVTLAAITGVATANNVAVGDTQVTLTGMTGVLPNGRAFTITGETATPTHKVTSHVEVSGDTTIIHFLPPVASAVASTAVLVIPSHTGPNMLEVRIGQGNLTYTEKKNYDYRLNRGLLDSVREGDQAPMELNFDFEWWYLTSASGEEITVEEALKQKGAASTWVSTSVDPCEPYAVDLVILYTPICAGVDPETIIFPAFRWETLDHNIKDAQISCKGTCNALEAISTRG
jgi:hypothetical protein